MDEKEFDIDGKAKRKTRARKKLSITSWKGKVSLMASNRKELSERNWNIFLLFIFPYL